jgi:uncharacterized protein YndB with AHSA1/START domain
MTLTMPTQKVFKGRVRARMAKTGESYTAARHQLLRKAVEPASEPEPAATAESGPSTAPETEALVSDEAMIRATGKSHEQWFAILDAWGATERKHAEIARWLAEVQGTPPWWTQNITVAYERARGLRATHQNAAGFSFSVNRTIGVGADRLLAAFTDDAERRRWLPEAEMPRRPTRAANTARFDWLEPPSRIVVLISAKGDAKAAVNVTHEQLPDAASTERLKVAWRSWLDDLKAFLERA